MYDDRDEFGPGEIDCDTYEEIDFEDTFEVVSLEALAEMVDLQDGFLDLYDQYEYQSDHAE